MTQPDPTKQVLLDALLRSDIVLERILAASMQARPASAEQVRHYLATAPRAALTIIDGLLPPPAPPGFESEPVDENRIVQSFVGLMTGGGDASRVGH